MTWGYSPAIKEEKGNSCTLSQDFYPALLHRKEPFNETFSTVSQFLLCHLGVAKRTSKIDSCTPTPRESEKIPELPLHFE
jgi:hypothetical protein